MDLKSHGWIIWICKYQKCTRTPLLDTIPEGWGGRRKGLACRVFWLNCRNRETCFSIPFGRLLLLSLDVSPALVWKVEASFERQSRNSHLHAKTSSQRHARAFHECISYDVSSRRVYRMKPKHWTTDKEWPVVYPYTGLSVMMMMWQRLCWKCMGVVFREKRGLDCICIDSGKTTFSNNGQKSGSLHYEKHPPPVGTLGRFSFLQAPLRSCIAAWCIIILHCMMKTSQDETFASEDV